MDREVWSLDKIRGLFDLTGKVAIVTGGSGAFGKAAAKGLAAFGADVVITGRHADTLDAAAADISRGGHQGHSDHLRRHRRRQGRGDGRPHRG